MDDVVELTLVQITECFAFKLPPRVRAGGWLAAEMTEQVWAGRLKIVQRGSEAAIFLLNKADGKVFAMCPITEGAVERCSDSSRYFALKIQNAQGRHAFIGLAFNDRNQAFDFNVALQEFNKDLEREKGLVENSSEGGDKGSSAPPPPTKDYSIKDGQKITVNLSSGGSTTRKKERSRPSGGAGGFLAPPPGDTPSRKGGGLLAPPPADSSSRRPKSGAGVGGDGFRSLLDEDAPAAAPAAAAAAPSNAWPGNGSDDAFVSAPMRPMAAATGGVLAPPASSGGGDGGFLDFASAPPPPPQQQSSKPAGNDMFSFMAAQAPAPASPPQQQQPQKHQQQQLGSPLYGMGGMSAALPPTAALQPTRPGGAGFPAQHATGVGGGGNQGMGGGFAGVGPATGGGFGPASGYSQQQQQQQKKPPSDDPFGGLF